MTGFVLTRDAKADLKGIARYTKARWGRAQREKYIVALDECFKSIAKNPQSGAECEEISAGYRRRLSGSHVIYYRMTKKEKVEIVRILHVNMEPGNYLPE